MAEHPEVAEILLALPTGVSGLTGPLKTSEIICPGEVPMPPLGRITNVQFESYLNGLPEGSKVNFGLF